MENNQTHKQWEDMLIEEKIEELKTENKILFSRVAKISDKLYERNISQNIKKKQRILSK